MPIDDGSVFIPRYLLNIERQISQCVSSDELDRLLARKAGHLARHSRTVEAKYIIHELRKVNQNFDPRLTGWISLSEGMIHHFENLNGSLTKEKFQKALMMGHAANDRELEAVSAAWLANSEFSLGEIDASIAHLKICFEKSSERDTDALGRALLLLGDLLNWTGKPDIARAYYKLSRIHAVKDGDIAMQNVMFFNSAAYAIAHLTFSDCEEPVNESAWRFIQIELESARNFNAALKISNLATMIPTLDAELKIIQKKWHEANIILCDTLPHIGDEGQKRLAPKLFAQRAWCRINLGDRLGARNDISNAMLHIEDCCEQDDLCVLHARIAWTEKLLGEHANAAKHQQLFDALKITFSAQQVATLDKLNPLLNIASIKAKNPA